MWGARNTQHTPHISFYAPYFDSSHPLSSPLSFLFFYSFFLNSTPLFCTVLVILLFIRPHQILSHLICQWFFVLNTIDVWNHWPRHRLEGPLQLDKSFCCERTRSFRSTYSLFIISYYFANIKQVIWGNHFYFQKQSLSTLLLTSLSFFSYYHNFFCFFILIFTTFSFIYSIIYLFTCQCLSLTSLYTSHLYNLLKVLLDSLVSPTLPITEWRSNIHGIGEEDLQGVRTYDSTFPDPTRPNLTQTDLTLSHITLPYLNLHYLTLPYLTLPYLTLPYLTLPHIT